MTNRARKSPSPFSPPLIIGRGRLRRGGQTSKLIVILGPTSSGKSALAIKLARKFNGEIISADSRQVYKGMDIGTGKVNKKEQRLVPHYLLDVVSPKKRFSVAEYKQLLKRAIAQIRRNNHIPFIVGGSPFYIYAVIDDLQIPEVKPNIKLRRFLAKKKPSQLFAMLNKLDPNRAKTIDKHNPARLIRAIEIVKTTGKPIPLTPYPRSTPYSPIILGVKKSPRELRKLINQRVDKRLKAGMVNEIKKLHKQGVSFKRLEELGLEYRYIGWHLQGKLSYQQMVEQLKNAIWQFAKRQMTWFKRDKRIHWITNEKQAEVLIKKGIQQIPRNRHAQTLR